MGDYKKKMKIDLDMGNNQIIGLVPETVTDLPTTNLVVGRIVVKGSSMYICVNPTGATDDDRWKIFSATSSTATGLTVNDIGNSVAGLYSGKLRVADIPDIEISKVTDLQTNLDKKLENVKFNGANLTITDKAVEIPRDLSQYINTTTNFTDKTYVDGQITTLDGKISAIKEFNVEVVDSLPETGVANTIYFVPQTGGSGLNVKDEYMWINSTWELIGTTEFKLTITQGEGTGISINGTPLQDASTTKDGLMTKEMVATVNGKADKSYVDDTFITTVSKATSVTENDTNVVTSGAVFTFVDDVKTNINATIEEGLAGKVAKTITVNGHALSDNVTVTKEDVGLGSVDNTSDANKPISTATQTALNKKVDKLTTKPTAGTYTKVDINAEGQVIAGQAKIAIADISDFPTLLTRYTASINGNGTTKAFSVPTDSITDISSVMVLDATDGSEIITGVKIANDKVEIGFNTAPATDENYTVVITAKPNPA